MYLVIFCYWVGPVPYLELFGVGPVEKNTLYNVETFFHMDLGGIFWPRKVTKMDEGQFQVLLEKAPV